VIAMLLGLAPATGQLVHPDTLGAWSGPRIAMAVISFIVLGGALLTITRKNPIAAVMSLVGTFFGLAASYALLYAHFLAALQVLVYAGAIMTLFVFVVMVLNREETEAVAWRGVILKAVGAFALVYTMWQIGTYLRHVVPAHPEAPPATFGTVEEVGTILFTDYLFVFEAVSVLLMIAVIAAVVVARTHKAVADTRAAGHAEPSHDEHGGHH
jgi:NADH-quinone oxidoreductase subunit J